MGEREAFERILASLHEAAMDDTRFSTASALIDEALHVHGNSLAFGDIGLGDDTRIYSMGIFSHGQRHHELEREYFESYFPQDERIPRFRQLPDSRLTHFPKLYSKKELRTSILYNEYLNRFHAQNSITVRLDGPNGSSICWAAHDTLKGEDWSSPQLDLFRRLLPHIRQYMCVRQSLVGADALGISLTKMLDTTGLGIIQLVPRGRIVEVNDRARDLLRTGDGLFDEQGFLFARKPEDNTNLQVLLKRALPPLGTQGVSGSTIVKRVSALPLVLHVHPLARQETDIRPWPVAALVLVVDPENRIRIDPSMVAEVLGLTKMESRVAVLLAEGKSVREIALAMSRKEGTIYWHVKNIFAKHGLSRQADLVRFVSSLANTPESAD